MLLAPKINRFVLTAMNALIGDGVLPDQAAAYAIQVLLKERPEVLVLSTSVKQEFEEIVASVEAKTSIRLTPEFFAALGMDLSDLEGYEAIKPKRSKDPQRDAKRRKQRKRSRERG